MTTRIRHFKIYHFFLRSQEKTKVNIKSSQNAYELSKLVNFWNLALTRRSLLSGLSWGSFPQQRLVIGA